MTTCLAAWPSGVELVKSYGSGPLFVGWEEEKRGSLKFTEEEVM